MPHVFSHLAFLPIIDDANSDEGLNSQLLLSCARIAPVVVPAPFLKSALSVLPRSSEYWAVLADDISLDAAIAILDAGATRIVSPNLSLIGQIPSERLVLALNEDTLDEVDGQIDPSQISAILLETPLDKEHGFEKSMIIAAREMLGGKSSRDAKDLFVMPVEGSKPTLGQLESLTALRQGATPCLPTSLLSAEAPPTSPTNNEGAAASDLGSSYRQVSPAKAFAQKTLRDKHHLPIDVLFLSSLTTDRPDALYPSVVASANGPSYGLVYSSPLSISLSILTAQATYQSRSRSSLWIKGATSGATQQVIAIRRDCDGDALEFIVEQKQGTGFCHTPRATSCFGPAHGLTALEATVRTRQASAPVGSYTKRLFDDPNMLEAKIREEAEEVCQANTWEETRLEAADLLYFLTVRCAAKGVSLDDVLDELDARGTKVTRRPGNAKAAYIRSASASSSTANETTPRALSPHSQVSSSADGNLQKTSTALPAAFAHVPAAANGHTKGDSIIPPVYDLTMLNENQRSELLKRPLVESKEMLSKVQPILSAVREQGDKALLNFIATLDRSQAAAKAKENGQSWDIVLKAPFSSKAMALPEETKQAIDVAFGNIQKFHAAQMNKESQTMTVETMQGIVCKRFARPIDRVGLYVPGGTAILPSTALMLGIPAMIAGCQHISFATPADKDGNVRPEIVYIAHRCGVKEIVRAGGAHAIAAMAYGTKSVTKVDKLFGPGNQWVTNAKMAVSMDISACVSIDMPAGPSEVLVIADSTAKPAFVASDLLAQAEHGPDSQVVLLAVDITDAHLEEIKEQVSEQALALPRVDVVRISISKSLIVRTKKLRDAIDFSNDYAPEHLILHLKDSEGAMDSIKHAGSIFVGEWSPESCGDYASGTNHTLPTSGFARQYSGVSTSSFLKHITSQRLTKAGLQLLGPTVEHLAKVEGLDAHARAVTVRLASKEIAANGA